MAHALRIPDTVTLVPLPPRAPELNLIERVWLHLRERLLPHRLLDHDDAVANARRAASNRLTPERPQSLCQVTSIRHVRP